jgi:hypothetical protein
MPQTPAYDKASRQAAQRAYMLVLGMLEAGEIGVVEIEVGYHRLRPRKRVDSPEGDIKVARGQSSIVETSAGK